MKNGTIVAAAITGIAVLVIAAASGFFGFMMWGLSLNGFMGQQRAVDISMFTYICLAIVTALLMVGLSTGLTWYLADRREWHAAVSALLSIVVFAVSTGVVHIACVIISAIVADQLRTNR